MPAYKRILLKLSGEALMGDDAYGINRATIVRLVREVQEVTAMGVEVAVVRMAALHGALDRLIDSVEREFGTRLPLLAREEKQRAIRRLDERGAFTLRRAVEDVADAMGVSRITVYNYLNALHRQP